MIFVAYKLPEENRYVVCYGITLVCFFIFAYQGSLNFAYVNEVMRDTSKYTVALGMHNFLCMGLACTVTPYVGTLIISFSREKIFKSGDDDARPFLMAYFFGCLLILTSVVMAISHKVKSSLSKN